MPEHERRSSDIHRGTATRTTGTAAGSVNGPTTENTNGYHRLIGGSVEVGEVHRDAITREVQEELGARIEGLTYLAAIENIFRINGEVGHEIVFLYSGTLDPSPALADATLTEADGSVVPVVWRPFADDDEPLPLFPVIAVPWLAHLTDHAELGGA
jgi:ADP-ribose pyrophosphatase YjhB (NUDIX family)